MIRFGKALSCFGIMGYLVIASLAGRNIREAVNANASASRLVNLVAGLWYFPVLSRGVWLSITGARAPINQRGAGGASV